MKIKSLIIYGLISFSSFICSSEFNNEQRRIIEEGFGSGVETSTTTSRQGFFTPSSSSSFTPSTPGSSSPFYTVTYVPSPAHLDTLKNLYLNLQYAVRNLVYYLEQPTSIFNKNQIVYWANQYQSFLGKITELRNQLYLKPEDLNYFFFSIPNLTKDLQNLSRFLPIVIQQ